MDKIQSEVPPKDKVTLSRRYRKLLELIEGESDYFSEESIKNRDVI
jgi:hypothetical protein